MGTTSQPKRTCRGCRAQKLKSQLNRWVLVEGKPTYDAHQNLPGRGVYTCSSACYDKIQKQLPYLLKPKKRST